MRSKTGRITYFSRQISKSHFSKLILTFCRYSSPLFPLTGIIYHWWSEQVELLCDEMAAQRTNSPVDIASALVKLKRIANSRGLKFVQPLESSFFGEDNSNFEERVERVLSIKENASNDSDLLQKSWGKPIKVIGFGYIFSLILLFSLDPLAVHHMLEIILTIF